MTSLTPTEEVKTMRPLVEALASFSCPNPKGRYLPACKDHLCPDIRRYPGHRHFGDIRNCGECSICKAKAFVALQHEPQGK